MKIKGSKLDDVLRGTDGDDVIKGKGGNDTLIGLGGLNYLKGGKGADTFVIDSSPNQFNFVKDFKPQHGDVIVILAEVYAGGLVAGSDDTSGIGYDASTHMLSVDGSDVAALYGVKSINDTLTAWGGHLTSVFHSAHPDL